MARKARGERAMTNAERQRAYRQRCQERPVYRAYLQMHADLEKSVPRSKTQREFLRQLISLCDFYRQIMSPEEMGEAMKFVEDLALDLGVEAWRRTEKLKHLY
jgi:hypothetical protein